MRSLLRYAFTLFAVISMALCAAVCVLWIRSYRATDFAHAGYWNYRPHRGFPTYQDASVLLIFHERGQCTVSVITAGCVAGPTHRRLGPGKDGQRWQYSAHPDEDMRRWAQDRAWGWTAPPPVASRWGIRTSTDRSHRTFSVPDPAPAAASAVLPAFWFLLARLTRKRRRAGCCTACGYDLRASPGRCPECGTVPASGGR